MRRGFRALLDHIAARGLDPRVPHTASDLAQEKPPVVEEEPIVAPIEELAPEITTNEVTNEEAAQLPEVEPQVEAPQEPQADSKPKAKSKKKKKSEA